MNNTTYKYFTTDELKCKHTGECDMDNDFMKSIETIREECGFPFHVSSAFRSVQHPIEAAKNTLGAHTTGKAMDILVYGEKAYRLIKFALIEGIPRIGVSQKGKIKERFIHLDTDLTKPHPMLWSY